MRRLLIALSFIIFHFSFSSAQEVMSEGYRQMWNDSVRQAIDQNIELYRKADAHIVLKNAK